MSTLVYPQLGTGALSQFPIRKTRRKRTVINEGADGGTVRLTDPAGETTEWRLEHSELTDDEATALEEFFAEAEGSLNGFTFLDPTANLLSWSGKLDAADWQKDPLLQMTDGIADPAQGSQAWRLSNTGAGPQGIWQTITGPGGYTYCWSIWVRSATPATVRMSIGNDPSERVITTGWSRLTMVGTGAAEAESMRFGMEVAAGATIDVYGPQVEAQGGASVYRATTRGGVYEDAHLSDDTFGVTRTGFNRNSCTVNIIHANHL